MATIKKFQIKLIFSAYQEILVTEEFKNLLAQLARDKNVNFDLQAVLPGEVIILNLNSETGITALPYYSNFTDDKFQYTTLRTIISSQLPENLWFCQDDGIWHPVAQMSGMLACLISQTRLAYRSRTPMLMNIPSPATPNYAPAYFSATKP